MSNGRLTEVQFDAIRDYVRGHVVHDLGAGSCELSLWLLKAGSKKVIAVDEVFSTPAVMALGARGLFAGEIQQVLKSFAEYYPEVDTIDVAFLSWPVNRHVFGLVTLLERATTVIYLGSSTDGNMCGSAQMWEHLTHREIMLHAPDRQNTLLVYGGAVRKPRRLVGEEWAGLRAWTAPDAPPIRYDEAQIINRLSDRLSDECIDAILAKHRANMPSRLPGTKISMPVPQALRVASMFTPSAETEIQAAAVTLARRVVELEDVLRGLVSSDSLEQFGIEPDTTSLDDR